MTVVQLIYLRQAAQVALLAGKLGGKEGFGDLPRQFRADHSRPEGEYVQPIVLDRLVCGVRRGPWLP